MRLVLTIGAAAMCAVCFGQYSSNFEPATYTGSASGTVITGQNGWYNPVAGSLDGSVYTYSGNALGFANNASGGSQFLGGMADGTNPMRAQHDVTYGATINTITFDFNGNYIGTAGTTADNLGSVSLQPSATANIFQTIYQWGSNTTNPIQFNANIGHASAAGGALVFDSPGAAWANIPVNHWFRQSVTWDFTTNAILNTTLQDLTAGGSVNSFDPVGWYLAGGLGNVLALPTPTAVRFFASGGAGDVMGYDNLTITPVPEPASMAALGLGALALLRKRRRA